MPSSNVAVIRGLYDRFAAGDMDGVLASMSPDIRWIEAEHNPYADGNPYIGPKAVLEGVFSRCAGEWDGFCVNVEDLLDAGDRVIMLGRYGGKNLATGRPLNSQVVHVWRVENGKAVAFQQYLDTLAFNHAMGTVQ